MQLTLRRDVDPSSRPRRYEVKAVTILGRGLAGAERVCVHAVTCPAGTELVISSPKKIGERI